MKARVFNGSSWASQAVRMLQAILLCLMLLCLFVATSSKEAQASPGDLMRVSANAAGEGANSSSSGSSVSADGRYVVFDSEANNLVPGDTNGKPDVFRKDLVTGEVVLVSVNAAGEQTDEYSGGSVISADGRYVAFASRAHNLVPEDPSDLYLDVFRKDLVTGEVLRCSETAAGVKGQGNSEKPAITSDGRYVVFESNAANLGAPPSMPKQIYRKDLLTGEIVLCSSNSSSSWPATDDCANASVSADGRYVAFETRASNLVEEEDPFPEFDMDVFRKDLVTGEIILCSRNQEGGEGDLDSWDPAISADGRYVAFYARCSNLVPGIYGGQVYRKDLLTGGIVCCSTSAEGQAGYDWSYYPSITPDGRYVAFYSYAGNLVYHDDNSYSFIYKKDLDTGDIVLCSTSSTGMPAFGFCFCTPGMSSDARYVTFTTYASNLIPDDTNGVTDVFRKEVAVSHWYFAEGYTGNNFQEYLCIGNFGDNDVIASVLYAFKDGTRMVKDYNVPARGRRTINVNSEVGPGREVSAVVRSAYPDLVVERTMYFKYQDKWTGGHAVMGARHLNLTVHFAEGYTGPYFDEYVCVFNPGEEDTHLTLEFQTQEAGQKMTNAFVPKRSRATFLANDPSILGPNYQTSLTVHSAKPVIVERVMYFQYIGLGAGWEGGHCTMGVHELSKQYYFAEGTTRMSWWFGWYGFHEWLTIQNPNAMESITVEAVYQLGPGQGGPITKSYNIGPGRRYTVFVPYAVGYNKDVSVRLSSSSDFFAERPMYFNYTYKNTFWEGGHCVIGSSAPADELRFAEGYTGPGFHQWLCLQNTSNEDSLVEITYYVEETSSSIVKTEIIPANTRVTFFVNDHAGYNLHLSTRVRVISGPRVMAERPMYFKYNGVWDGGSDVIGFAP